VEFEIVPIDRQFAFEVRGVDLWRSLEQGVVDALEQAWSSQGVLVFRRQSLSEEELVAFSGRFGDPDHIVRDDWRSGNHPAVTQISNMKNSRGQSIGGLGSGELGWHTDQSYVANPATGSILYMVEMPKVGANTYWANLNPAYEALPAATQERIEGLHAVYDYVKRQSTYDDEKPMSEELRRRTPPVAHPLVSTDPVSGRRSLYLDPTTTVGIRELPGPEGQALLEELNRHATQPEFVYTHHWQVGDVIMWDNGFLLHRRDDFDPSHNRLLKRTTIRLSPDRHIIPSTIPFAA